MWTLLLEMWQMSGGPHQFLQTIKCSSYFKQTS